MRNESIKFHQLLFFLLVLLLPTQLGRHFWPQWSYVLGLRVDYFSPTIYLTDILVVGVLGLWVLEILREKRKSFSVVILNLIQNLYRSRIKCGMTFFFPISIFFFLLANCFLAQNQAVAFYKLIKILEFFLLGLYIAKAKIDLSLITYHLSLATIYSSLIALAQFLRQSSLNGIFYWLGERTFSLSTPGIAKAVVGGRLILRPYATFPHPNVLAGFILVSLILTLPFLFKKSKLSAISYQLSAISTILISFSRSAWLVGLAVGFWYLAVHFWKKRGKAKLFPIAFLFILLFTVYCLLFTVFLPFSTDEAVVQRLELVKISLAMIKESPLTGVGLGNFIVRLPDFWQTAGTIRFLQPVHNIFLLVAAETGLVGLVIFLWFLILTYKRLLSCYLAKLLNRKKVDFSDFPITNSAKTPSEIQAGSCQLLITALSSILLLGLFDHYWLTLQQTQLLFSIVLGLSWGLPEVKIRKS